MCAGDIVAVQVRQFQKDRDEQPRSEFRSVISSNLRLVMSTQGSAMQFFTILRTVFGRRRLLLALHSLTGQQTSCGRGALQAIQCFTILQVSSGRIRLFTSLELFTILHTVFGRRKLLLAMQSLTSQQTSCGRRTLQATQRFTILQVSSGSMRLLISLEGFTILHTEFGRRRLLLPLQFLTSQQTAYAMFAKNLDRGIIFEQNCSSLIGVRIGEASNPGPRFRRRGPRSSASMAARRERREAFVEKAYGILEGQQINVQREAFVNVAHKSAWLFITYCRSHSYAARNGRQTLLSYNE